MKYVLAFLLLASCVTAQPQAQGIVDFHKVSDGIFRGAQPNDADISYLARELHVKTIVKMNLEDYDMEKAAAEREGIELVYVPLSSLFEPENGDIDLIEKTIQEKQPVYVHCEHGHDRTGLAIGIERVEHEGWSAQKAHDEMEELGYHPILIGLERYYWARERGN